MIRWQSYSSDYRFSDSRIQSTEKTKTSVSLVIPLIGCETVVNRFCDSQHEQITGGTEGISRKYAGIPGLSLERFEGRERSIEVPRMPAELPLLHVNDLTDGATEIKPVVEGFLTGATNATAGLALGVTACFFFGPAGGYTTWALWSGGLIGAASGVQQAKDSTEALQLREFVLLANDFLVSARETNMSPNAIARFRMCCEKADSHQRQRLMHEVYDVCKYVLGRQNVTPLLNALQRMPRMPVHVPQPHFDGTNWSAQGAINAAHGGR